MDTPKHAKVSADGVAYQYGVQLVFIRPGKLVENSYIDSFNGRLCDECLNVQVFFALTDVREKRRALAPGLQPGATPQRAG